MPEKTDVTKIDESKIHGYCTIKVELDDNGQACDLTFITINEELAQIIGRPVDQLIGDGFYKVFPKGDRKWLKQFYEAAYLKKSINFDDISKEVEQYIHMEIYPVGKIGYCACVICDVREDIFNKLKQQEQQEELLKAYEEEKQKNTEIRHYAETLGFIYPLIIYTDYLNNYYTMVEYDGFVNKTASYSGTIDDLISVGASTLPNPKEAEAFFNLFNREAVIKAFKQGKKELSLRHSQNGDDGKVHYMDTHVICTECSEDKITGVSVSKCIDDEAQKDYAIQQANEHAEVINALATIYTTIMEADLITYGFKIIQTNSPMKTVCGDKDEGNFDEVMEDVLKFYMVPEDIDRMREFVDLSTVSKRLGSDTTLVTEYKAPYDRWFESRFIAKKRDENGNVISAIYAARDITSEKLKELNYRDQIHEQLMISSTLARNFKNVYLADLKKKTVKILKLEAGYVNVENEGIGVEFPFESFLNHWLNNIVSSNNREELSKIFTIENVEKYLKENNELTGTYQSETNGETHNFQYNVSKVDEDGSKIIIGFQNIDDIIRAHLEEENKRREIEQAYQKQLEEAAKEADRANKAKTEFLMRMSHDIRTPLNGIIGMLDIADQCGNDIEKVRECRLKVRESSDILLELINEVLDMSKLESGEVVLEYVPFNLKNLFSQIFVVIDRLADDQDIEIIKDFDVEHIKYLGSPMHLKRLILNILSNAVKYNRSHGKVYFICKEKNFDGKTSTLEITIRDTGIGMSEEFQKHLFEPFQQENAAARTKYAGTGLGLPIAKNLVEKMNGTISFTSKKDVGTTFIIQLPLEVNFSETVGIVHDDKKVFSIANENILLVEDNDINLEIAKFILENSNANVIVARNGLEAVEIFNASKPNEISAILMDIMMPVMDGYEATRRIRNSDREEGKLVPILAMTANAFSEDRIACKNAGMNAHIPKPLDADFVVRIIAEQINAEKERKQNITQEKFRDFY